MNQLSSPFGGSSNKSRKPLSQDFPTKRIYLHCPEDDQNKVDKAIYDGKNMSVNLVDSDGSPKSYTRTINLTQKNFDAYLKKGVQSIADQSRNERVVTVADMTDPMKEDVVFVNPKEYFDKGYDRQEVELSYAS